MISTTVIWFLSIALVASLAYSYKVAKWNSTLDSENAELHTALRRERSKASDSRIEIKRLWCHLKAATHYSNQLQELLREHDGSE